MAVIVVFRVSEGFKMVLVVHIRGLFLFRAGFPLFFVAVRVFFSGLQICFRYCVG